MWFKTFNSYSMDYDELLLKSIYILSFLDAGGETSYNLLLQR